MPVNFWLLDCSSPLRLGAILFFAPAGYSPQSSRYAPPPTALRLWAPPAPSRGRQYSPGEYPAGAKKKRPGEAAFERIRNSLVFGRSKGFADLGFNLIAQLDVVL